MSSQIQAVKSSGSGRCIEIHSGETEKDFDTWATWQKSDEDHQTCMTEAAGANLRFADFHGKDLSYSDFHGADLEGADFHQCDLCKADFSGANLKNASLNSSDLRCADLQGAHLDGADLKNARIDAKTRLPFDSGDIEARGLIVED